MRNGRSVVLAGGLVLALGIPARGQESPPEPPAGKAVASPLGQGSSAAAAIPAGEIDRVVASVGAEAITFREVLDRVRMSGGPRPTGSEAAVPTPAELRAALDDLVAERLLLAEARRLSLTVSDADVDRQIEQIRSQNQWSESDFAQAIRMLGFPTMEAYRAHARMELLKTQVLRVKVGSKVHITDREVDEEFQRRHPDNAEDEVHLAHIVFLVPEDADLPALEALARKADEVQKEVATGSAPFEEYARRYSQDGSAPRGGDVGWFTRGKLQLALENVAFALEVGEVSPVVQSALGFHILKVLERRRAPLADPEEARRRIRFDLSEAAFSRLYREYLEGLKTTGRVILRGLPGVPES
ncbi:MAG TPA: peptidylprolyl isomerase [Myxococcota bacterium]|nr:peptidylprolyl isomerase [Myxococcota bacterium]HQK49871.1 peptidylprolyl isomerase [Myxococcota bacterium]